MDSSYSPPIVRRDARGEEETVVLLFSAGGNAGAEIPLRLWNQLIGPKPDLGKFVSRDFCTWVPDEIRGRPVYPACFLHDYLYSVDEGVGGMAEFWFYRNTVRCYTYYGGSLFWGVFHGLVRSTGTRFGGPLRKRFLAWCDQKREAAVVGAVILGAGLFRLTLKLLGS